MSQSWRAPLWYAQRLAGRRPDITVVGDRTLLEEDAGDLCDVIHKNLGVHPMQGDRS